MGAFPCVPLYQQTGVTNDYFTKGSRSRKRDSCKVVFEYSSPFIIHSLIKSDMHTRTQLSLTQTHTYAHKHKPLFPKTAKVSKGILFGWDHSWGDGVW